MPEKYNNFDDFSYAVVGKIGQDKFLLLGPGLIVIKLQVAQHYTADMRPLYMIEASVLARQDVSLSWSDDITLKDNVFKAKTANSRKDIDIDFSSLVDK